MTSINTLDEIGWGYVFLYVKTKKVRKDFEFCSKCFKLQGRLAQWGLKTKEKYKLEKPQQHLLLVKAVLYGEEIFLEIKRP